MRKAEATASCRHDTPPREPGSPQLGTPDPPRRRLTVPQCGVASDAVLDRLETAFSKRRAELLASDAGRWALFVQPANRRRQPELVGCYDTESEACEIGYRSPTGGRFLVKAVLEQDPVISIPWAVPANRL